MTLFLFAYARYLRGLGINFHLRIIAQKLVITVQYEKLITGIVAAKEEEEEVRNYRKIF